MRPVRTLVALAAVMAIALSACGDDDDDDGAAAADTTVAGGPGQTVTVKAIDYEYQGIPSTVAAGTKLVLENDSVAELHEMVAFKLPDGEKRSVADLVALPEEEGNAVLGDGPPAFVMLALPNKGEPMIPVGDGTVAEPGRYIVLCNIPLGVTPEQYLNAPESEDGPPEIPGAGPPHLTKGMYAEFTVK